MKKTLLLLAAVATASGAFAEGYQVNNFSARQAGMANVGTAMKLGAESIYFNPAATAFQESKFNISVGATGILSYVSASTLPSMENGYESSLTEDSDNKMSTPLHMYINYKPAERWAVGLGFYTPNGSSMNWGDNWSGSHLIQQINLAAYTFQPTVSFRICDRLSVGAGLMLTWGNFDLSRAMLPIGAGNKTLAQGFNTIGKLLPALGAGAGLSPAGRDLLHRQPAGQIHRLGQAGGQRQPRRGRERRHSLGRDRRMVDRHELPFADGHEGR